MLDALLAGYATSGDDSQNGKQSDAILRGDAGDDKLEGGALADGSGADFAQAMAAM